MSREHGKGESDREEAKRILATATDQELELLIKRAGIVIDVRGPYPTIRLGMRTRKAANYAEAVHIAAAVALGLDKLD